VKFDPSDPLWRILAAIDDEPTGEFRKLVETAKLNPKTDFRNACLTGLPLKDADISEFDFSGSDLRGTGLRHTKRSDGAIISNETKLDPVDREWWSRRKPWAAVWLELWRDAMSASREKIVLVESGSRWLATADPHDAGWASIWRRIWRSRTTPQERLTDLADQAIRWLSLISPVDRSWSSVWRALWDKKADVPENRLPLVELAEAWLVEAPLDHTGWATVWRRLYDWAAPTGRTDVAKIALTWLGRVDPNHAGWYIVWCSLWNRESALRPELATVAMAWLEHSESRRGWPLVWRNLSEVAETNPNLRNEIFHLALRWLDRTRTEKIRGTSLTRPLIVEALRNDS
jgi:hypothetical protein